MIFIFVTLCMVSQIDPNHVSEGRPSAVLIAAPAPDLPKAQIIEVGSKPIGNLENDQRLIGVSRPVQTTEAVPRSQDTGPARWPIWLNAISFSGFARLGLFYTFPIDDNALIGNNGGFRIADFRLGVAVQPTDRLRIVTSVELAAPLASQADPTIGRRIVELRDAFVQYQVCRGFIVKAGQMRPPYAAEMLLGDELVRFTDRSVLATGLTLPEGFGPTQPLAPNRQVGLQLFSQRFGEHFGIKYALGVFNGNGPNQLLNDNNSVMPVGRVQVDFKEHLTLGINASYNAITEGVRPTRLTTFQFNYGAELEAHGFGISGLLGILGRSSTFSDAGLLGETALGALAQVGYVHEPTGLEGAARLAYLDPSSTRSDDNVTELALMVGIRPAKLPFRVLLQYTHREEPRNVAVANDSLDLMWHAVW
jgi:Phosphate-selective porin O and P